MRCHTMKMLWAACLGAAGILSPVSAQAGFEACNDTNTAQSVAFVQKANGAWRVDGWREIAPNSCETLLDGPLQSRFYYLRLRDRDETFLHTSVRFCTSRQDQFQATGSRDCHQQKARPLEYARIDVGTDTRDASVNLSQFLKTEMNSSSRAIQVNAVFQSCKQDGVRGNKRCCFVGPTQEIIVRSNANTSADVLSRLDSLKSGTPVALEGEVLNDLNTTFELKLTALKSRPSDAAHQMLIALQGSWVSDADENDHFTVAGATRANVYAGIATSNEFFSIGTSCQDYEFDGLALHSWNKDESGGLCYLVEELTEDRLVLQFLSSGRSLAFHRP